MPSTSNLPTTVDDACETKPLVPKVERPVTLNVPLNVADDKVLAPETERAPPVLISVLIVVAYTIPATIKTEVSPATAIVIVSFLERRKFFIKKNNKTNKKN
ncbi:hypothetical protein A3G55_03850 [Candidatus Giovannonibacteria bacterium RIFCSPLOWO2_12_FULL_44_25]|uniref:Uncharacterized protein n=1 Tax=Candidatus Giovannonibacteria bacterium RIFCSPHIGHO2_02_FULL_45_40 TaxID=1798337 RepID=A0A1F5W8F9_9BACT|nr:MAG: hypothetical protein A2120_02235 [Candidatus Giovannonibacteria bacterium GWA2_45_15]OGF59085.1 MAG: hypothetical protein A2W40_00400 [Candidatus Giovannonibacteria bacterium RIFCSPHIGHO2_01_45_12]OGF61303.1 MAG: hypothetical protein A2656_05070 [Candidatus Giovannonibacteria bacterium RIFCSPHIGHO2_01_FULL_44_100]OGF71830.1 MAG: hypothetical protein A3C05_02415 [Candidatus Giovannonibacteria bacterium RIFCSPHIGHO2_02_FULL_45_40]OGF83463.1 MAG: hypothetical protein A3E63_00090 [Candidatu